MEHNFQNLIGVAVTPSNKPRRKGANMPIMSREQLLAHILTNESTLEVKAIIAFIYLTGARISEIVPNKIRGWRGITLGQIVKDGYLITMDINERPFWIVENVPVEKLREKVKITLDRKVYSKKVSKLKYRNIPINMDYDKDFIEIFLKYLESEFPENCNPNVVLFERTRVWAIKRLKKDFGLFPHYLRHLRLTHLVKDFGISDAHLQLITGWDSTTTAQHYRHLNWQDVAKMIS